MAQAPHEHAHGASEDHAHGALRFLRAEADDAVIASLRPFHPTLADNLLYSRRYDSLTAEEKATLVASQRAVERHPAWTPGYHSDGDLCATCGTPTSVIWTDVFESGALPYAAFIDDVPVHARADCIGGFAARVPRRSPQALDKVRRETTRDRTRPTARMTQFFRHDVFAHPPFELEDWANSVGDANEGKLDRSTMRDIERLLHWVHHRLYH